MGKYQKIRITFFLFLACLLVVSCTSPSSEDTETFTGSLYDDITETPDLNGYDYMLTFRSRAYTPSYGDSAAGDKLLKRYKDAGEKFNCSVTPICDMGDSEGVFLQYCVGNKATDLLLTQLRISWQRGFFTNGIYAPYSDLDIDLTDIKYGEKGLKQAGTIGEDIYGVFPYYWTVSAVGISTVTWFNPAYIERYGQPDPFELYENERWDWAHFDSMVRNMRDDTDPDVSKHDYAVAYNNDNAYIELAAIASNNGKLVDFESNGRMVNNLDSVNIREALEFVNRMVADGFVIMDGGTGNREPFVTGHRGFYIEYIVQGLSSEGADKVGSLMEDSFEWIMFPYGPRADQSVITTQYSYYTGVFAMISNADTSCTEVLFPYLFDILPGDTADTWDSEFKSMNFYSDRSYEFYKMILSKSEYDYTNYIPFDTVKYQFYNISVSEKTVTEAFSSISDSVQSYMDERYNIPMKIFQN